MCLFAAIVFVGHLLTFALIELDQPAVVHWLARVGQFLLMGLVFWRFRSRNLLPTSGAERQLWSIWLGFLLADGMNVLVQVEWSGADQPLELRSYPFSAILTGLAFFVMGSSYWGRCYAIGLAFFLLAGLMRLAPAWAPLGFGTLLSTSLLVVGLHVRGCWGEERR